MEAEVASVEIAQERAEGTQDMAAMAGGSLAEGCVVVQQVVSEASVAWLALEVEVGSPEETAREAEEAQGVAQESDMAQWQSG